MNKILFILHEDSRTGAPLYILSFFKWLKNKGKSFDVLVIKKLGHINSELGGVVEKLFYISDLANTSVIKRIINRKILHKKPAIFELLEKKIDFNNYSIVYGNTIESLNLTFLIKTNYPQTKTILHIHEGLYHFQSISKYKKSIETQIQKIDKLIFVSNKSKNEFLSYYKKTSDYTFNVIPPFICNNVRYFNHKRNKSDKLIFSVIGSMSLQKGVDLIPLLIWQLKRLAPDLNFKFLIIGEINNALFTQINYDIRKFGFHKYIEFIGQVKSPINYIQNSNLIISFSRSETFSLVSLEAIQLGKKIICFENCLGITDYLPEYFIQVKFLDMEELAKKIINNSKKENFPSIEYIKELNKDLTQRETDGYNKIYDLINE